MMPALIEAATVTTRPSPTPFIVWCPPRFAARMRLRLCASSHDPPIKINCLAAYGLGREALDGELAGGRAILRPERRRGGKLGDGIGQRRVVVMGNQNAGLTGQHDFTAAGHV